MSAARISAGERVQRLLAIMQWVAARPTGVPVDDVCDRFGLRRADLVKELEMASMVGADSVNYDEMPFEVIIEDGRVWVRLFSFDRPMRLTPAEGLALVASADALVGDDPDPDSPLARALAKLAALLGVEPGADIDVELDPEGGATGRLLADAVERSRRVRFTYWSYGRDVVSTRVVEPWRVFTADGAWYLAGLDVERADRRHFRLDRMDAVELLDEPASPAPADLETTLTVSGGAPEVVLDVPPDARWVAEALPVVAADPQPDGSLRVTLAVAGSSWLERLLLRLGPEARVVSIDPTLGGPDVLARAAHRVLSRYRGNEGAPR